jgi:hypothetical protein
MTVMYASSSICSVNAGEGHNGCGEPHVRPMGADGLPVQPWGIDCPSCADFLSSDPMWSPTIEDIVETFDEWKSRENYAKKGIHARDSLMAIAMARMAGIGPGEIPPALSKLLTGLPASVPGAVLCGKSHAYTPGSRFCRECGEALTRPAPQGRSPPGPPGEPGRTGRLPSRRRLRRVRGGSSCCPALWAGRFRRCHKAGQRCSQSSARARARHARHVRIRGIPR